MIRIGKIVATHGIQGALILTHVVGESKWLKKSHVLMVEMNKGSYIPYFISALKSNNNEEYIINVEEVNTVEQARKLVTKHVYVAEDILVGMEAKSPLLWIGFKVIDREKGDIGVIEDVVQTGKQWLAKLIINETEVLLPLIDQTIVKVNIKTKSINMDLPEGLIEVYIGS